jgi:hypothetical protein
MPYDSQSVMWQLSFPMPEEEAKALSAQGTKAQRRSSVVERNGTTPFRNFSGDLRSSGFWLSCLWPRITRFRIVSQADQLWLVMQLTLWVHLKDRSKSSATRCASALEGSQENADPYRNGENPGAEKCVNRFWIRNVRTQCYKSKTFSRSGTVPTFWNCAPWGWRA